MSLINNTTLFRMTQNTYLTDRVLQEAIKQSKKSQSVISERSVLHDTIPGNNKTEVILSSRKVLEATEFYASNGYRTAVITPCSPVIPGGMTFKGGIGTEETLCSHSTLYSCLNTERILSKFYYPHMASADKTMGDIVYTPYVVVFRRDNEYHELMNEMDWYQTDVISVTPPVISTYYGKLISSNEKNIWASLEKRLTRALTAAAKEGIEAVVLPPFGCASTSYDYDPRMVAKVLARVTNKFRSNFKAIEIALFSGPTDRVDYLDVFEPVFMSAEEEYSARVSG